MSFFGSIGRAFHAVTDTVGHGFRAVGKGALTVGKVAANIAGNQIGVGNVFDIGGKSDAPNNDPSQQIASPPALDHIAGTADNSNKSWLQSFFDDVSLGVRKVGNAFNSTHPTITVDHTLDVQNSKMPTWIPIAGAGLLLVLLLPKGGRRRY